MDLFAKKKIEESNSLFELVRRICAFGFNKSRVLLLPEVLWKAVCCGVAETNMATTTGGQDTIHSDTISDSGNKEIFHNMERSS